MKSKNALFTFIRIILVVGLITAIIVFIFLQGSVSKTPPEDVFAAVTAEVKTDKMQEAPERYFKKFFGLNAADYDAVLYYAPVSNMDAQEMLVVKLKDASQEETLKEAILARQQTRENTYEGYAPEQYALTQKYILDSQKGYVLYVIDENADAIDAAFSGAL